MSSNNYQEPRTTKTKQTFSHNGQVKTERRRIEGEGVRFELGDDIGSLVNEIDY